MTVTSPRPRRRCIRVLVVLLLAAGLLPVLGAVALAHPLGNFTTNTSATLLTGPQRTRVVYVLDLAEVPTQQARRNIAEAGGEPAWAAAECDRIAAAQSLRVDGRRAVLDVDATSITLPPGQAGLQTLRLTCLLSAATATSGADVELTFADGYAADRIGWREVVAAGDTTTMLSADVPAMSASQQLRAYPEGEVSATTTARLRIDGRGGSPAPAALLPDASSLVATEPGSGLAGLVQSYTDLVARQDLTVPFVLLAFVLAIGLGTAHAVAPGHGKTVIAAYMLSGGGRTRQAMMLGSTVAITHTIGVLLLGLLVQTSSSLAPERLYPLLGLTGGLLFAALGAGLLFRALRTRGHTHTHDAIPGHTHTHAADHGHPHAEDDEHARPAGQPGWRGLVLPGLAGGMVPSPSALLVLLGGIALGRAWFGVLLVLAYGVGMAVALVGAGYLLHRLRDRVERRLESGTWARVSAALPLVTSSLIVVGGLAIAVRSVIVG